jgi:N-acyl-D-aspartate/D-glutamate deacylase
MHTAKTKFETLIKCVKIFNNGEQPIVEDIGISGGRIVARGKDLEASTADQIIDGSGLWALPGMFDIHTHYDLELEVAPALSESVRHGTTSVVIANCSLGLAFGAQRKGAIDPIVDCYARVENIPKAVLRACADKVTWTDPDAYLKHLSQINLGPNVVTLMPHSMLRIEVMGFEDSISRDPTTAELTSMADTLPCRFIISQISQIATKPFPLNLLNIKSLKSLLKWYEKRVKPGRLLRQRTVSWGR